MLNNTVYWQRFVVVHSKKQLYKTNCHRVHSIKRCFAAASRRNMASSEKVDKIASDIPSPDSGHGNYLTTFLDSEKERILHVNVFVDGELKTKMERNADETIDRTLFRMHKTLFSRKKMKFFRASGGKKDVSDARAVKGDQISDEMKVIDRHGTELNTQTSRTGEIFLSTSEEYVLQIGELKFRIFPSPPLILDVSLRGLPIVGMPLAPKVDFRFVDPLQTTILYRWKRLETGELVGEERIYAPQSRDVGSTLIFECEVKDISKGYMMAKKLVMEHLVVAQEFDRSLIESRAKECTEWIEARNQIRIVSYNLLADQYSYNFDDMYPYCEPQHWNIEYRAVLQAREVLDYRPCVIGLQEMDAKQFFGFWMPQLEDRYHGFFTSKAGNPPLCGEGVSMFFRKDKFDLVRFEEIVFRDYIRDHLEEFPWIKEFFKVVPELESILLDKVTTVAQMVHLRCKAVEEDMMERDVILVNQHCFFHPSGGNVRCIHAKVLTHILEEELRNFHKPNTPIVICGDFNAESFDLGMKFLLEGHINADHSEWVSSSTFRWNSHANLTRTRTIFEDDDYDKFPMILKTKSRGVDKSVENLMEQVEAHEDANINEQINMMEELEHVYNERTDDREELKPLLRTMRKHILDQFERMTAEQKKLFDENAEDQEKVILGVGANLKHSLDLRSACNDFPFTNFTPNFSATLDWILVSKNVKEVIRIAPPIYPEQVTPIAIGIPNKVFPSDHISLCADLLLDCE